MLTILMLIIILRIVIVIVIVLDVVLHSGLGVVAELEIREVRMGEDNNSLRACIIIL